MLLLLLSAPARADSVLYFPLAASGSPIGIAIVNPGVETAQVSLVAYATTGQQVAAGTLTVPSGGQVARLGSEIFGSASNPSGGVPGWIEAVSAATGLQGFEMVGDFTGMVAGAEAAPAASDQVVPIAGKAVLYLVNPATAATSASIRAYDAGGLLVHTLTPTIPAKGIYVSEGLGAWATARHLRIVSPVPVAASVLLQELLAGSSDQAAVNGADAASAPSGAVFAHAAQGPLGASSYSTLVGVTNVAAAIQTVTIIFNREGSPPLSVEQILPANGSLQKTLQELFLLPAAFQSGWVEVKGMASLNAFLVNFDVGAGGVAAVPMQAAARTSLLFALAANRPPWQTGMAVLNAAASDAAVEVFGMNSDGTLIGAGGSNPARSAFTLSAGTRTARLIEEMMPVYRFREADGGFLFIRSTNNVPLVATELFFLRSGAAMATVPAEALAPGITYNPPTPQEKIVTIAFWNTSDCSGEPVAMNRFPVSYGNERCYTWPGRSGQNSATNFVCGLNSLSYTQWTTLTCSGGQNPPGTRKTTYTDRCTQDFPPTLYARIVDFTGCQ